MSLPQMDQFNRLDLRKGRRVLRIAVGGASLGRCGVDLLSRALSLLPSSVDVIGSMGCGTDRDTVELLLAGPWPAGPLRRVDMLFHETSDETCVRAGAELVDVGEWTPS